MEKKLTILLVEDEEDVCNEFIKEIDEFEDVSLIGVTKDSNEAIKYICDSIPDAIILDLELHKGQGNGLLLLNNLRKMSIDVVPYILITTNNTSVVTYESAREMGADFIMSKHQADYSVKSTVEFLQMMKPFIHRRIPNTAPAHATTELPEVKQKRILARIKAELNNVGISPKVVGYTYLVDAIQLVIKQPVQNLCTIISKKYNKTESSVERGMQNAIQKAWRTSDIEDLSKYYTARIRSDKGVPTLTEFIYYYAIKIRDEY